MGEVTSRHRYYVAGHVLGPSLLCSGPPGASSRGCPPAGSRGGDPGAAGARAQHRRQGAGCGGATPRPRRQRRESLPPAAVASELIVQAQQTGSPMLPAKWHTCPSRGIIKCRSAGAAAGGAGREVCGGSGPEYSTAQRGAGPQGQHSGFLPCPPRRHDWRRFAALHQRQR